MALCAGVFEDNLYAFDTSTGAILWQPATGNPVYSSSPGVANCVVYVGSGDGNLYAYSLSVP